MAFLLAFAGAACGDAGEGGGRDTLAIRSQPPADTANILDEPLTPSTLRDRRMEELSDAEQRILQDYVNRGVMRDSLEAPGSQGSLGGWLDSNLTVGQVIALYQSTQRLEPLPPEQPAPPGPAQVPAQQE